VIKLLKNYLNPYKEISIAPLVVFRIIFGVLLFFSTLRFLLKGWVYEMYIKPEFFFGYLGFEWVKPLPGNWMYLPFFILLLSTLGIILGMFYRWSTVLAFISFSYIELLDKTNYLNHYYFISLMCFLFMFVPANRSFSLDVKFKLVEAKSKTENWYIGIFKFQLAVVYIFAGIAKLHSDWLFEAQPLKIWLQAHRDMPIFGTLLKEDWVAYFFSWFGCIYDLFIVVFLLTKKTRFFAYIAVIVFHFVTWYLLPIGIFPWVMIFSTTIFFSVSFHEKILFYLKRVFRYIEVPINSNLKTRKAIYKKILLGTYIALQLILPFRYILYPGNLFWNEEGFRFSWRVMLMHKEGYASFYVKDKKTNGEIAIDNRNYLTENQVDQMATQPDMILQYASYLEGKFKDSVFIVNNQRIKLEKPIVSADVFVSLNGRQSQLFVSKKHDLTKIPYNLAHRNWIEPFKE